ncbi:hypothetical protein [Seonamhaeicola sp.]|uniref:hypothetical protein n=1 Tax=Seonamhaeicola sp. TaxID=1912245 RepID=UPI00261FF225|nr:hypothetical protein [Seonamhaeicola sp.]
MRFIKVDFRKLNLDHRVKAGALQLTMYIVVVVALLLSGFVLFIHTHKRFDIRAQLVKEAVNNAEKGINYTLQSQLNLNDTLTVNLKDQDYKTLKVHKDHWGFFEKVTSISKIKHNTFKKIALVGTIQPKQERTALYVKDNNRPLVVVGNSHIQGTTYLPKQGVRTGNISGHSYYGKALVYGKIKNSQSNLPELSNEWINELKQLETKIKEIHPDQFIDLNSKKSHQNSFYDPLQVIYSTKDMLLSGVSLTGHILVQSETKIVVDAGATLKDIILIAPEIEIKSYCKGAFQAIAGKNLTVGAHCELDYPSALYVNDNNADSEKDKVKHTPFISVGSGSTVKGVVAYVGKTKNYKPQIFIDEAAGVIGEVYCNKNLELLGTVKGSVFTSNFIANQSGSAYQNHIYNGEINVDHLPVEYVGLLFEGTKKGIAKWLY